MLECWNNRANERPEFAELVAKLEGVAADLSIQVSPAVSSNAEPKTNGADIEIELSYYRDQLKEFEQFDRWYQHDEDYQRLADLQRRFSDTDAYGALKASEDKKRRFAMVLKTMAGHYLRYDALYKQWM